jgi:phosphorylcholine metabolism protein LicD
MNNTYLTDDEKFKYLNEINKFYKYNSKIIDTMMNKKIKILKNTIIKKCILTNNEKKSLFELSKKTIKFLDDYLIDYWLDGGSLLGAVRDGKMISWDDDIDLAITSDQFIKLIEIIKNVSIQNGNYYILKKYDIKFYFISSNNSINKNLKYWLVKVEHLKNTDNKELFIDLISYVINSKNQYVSNLKWFSTFFYNINDIYPLKIIKLEDQYFKCVNNPIPYLNNGYWFWKHLGKISHTHFGNTTNINKDLYFKLDNI